MQTISELLSANLYSSLVNMQTWDQATFNVDVKYGNNTMDCTSMIQKAIDERADKYGFARIKFGPGVYRFEGRINMDKLSTPDGDGLPGLIIEGASMSSTVLLFTGEGVFLDLFGDATHRKFPELKSFRIWTDKDYKPGTVAVNMQYNQRRSNLTDVEIRGFEKGVCSANNWLMNFNRVYSNRCKWGLYLDNPNNAINIYGGEHRHFAEAGIYIAGGEDIVINGCTVETSDDATGGGHGILIDSVKYLTIMGLYSEHMKGHVIYKRGFVPGVNDFRTILIINGMNFNFSPPTPDIKIEKPVGSDGNPTAGNLTLLATNFQRVDLGTTSGGIADWCSDYNSTTTDSFKNIYVNDRPGNYSRRFETSFMNMLLDRLTLRNPNGYDLLTLAMNAPYTYDTTTQKWVPLFNQRFMKIRREDAKNKLPSYLTWKFPSGSAVTINARKLTITADGTEKIATTSNHIGGEFNSQILKPATVYTLSGVATGSAPGVVMRLTFYDKNKVNVGTRDFTGSPVTFTTPATTDYALASFIVPASVMSGTYSFEDMQLEEGDSATTYAGYHVDAFSLIVTPEGDEVRGLVGGDNVNDWKADGSGGNKVFYASNSMGAFGAINHFYSPRYRYQPVVDSEVTRTNIGFVSDTDKVWKFRDQYGITYPVEMTRVLSKGGRNLSTNLQNAHVGMMVYDTTLGKPVWLKQVSPLVWVDATGADVT